MCQRVRKNNLSKGEKKIICQRGRKIICQRGENNLSKGRKK